MTQRLFLAFIPGASTIQRISELAAALREQHGLKARLRPLAHFHVTLQWLGDFSEVPDALVSNASKVCERLAAQTAPFEIYLDHVLSFQGRPGNQPLVLGGTEERNTSLFQFQKNLVADLAKVISLPKENRRKFRPHLTLMYDRKDVAETPITPVNWRAEEFILIRSEVGATRHHHLDEWKFSGSEPAPVPYTPDLFR